MSEPIVLKYRDLSGGGWSTLNNSFDEQGYLRSIVSEGVMGVYVDEEGDVRLIQTISGSTLPTRPIVGPDGEITYLGKMFPTINHYIEWSLTEFRPSSSLIH